MPSKDTMKGTKKYRYAQVKRGLQNSKSISEAFFSEIRTKLLQYCENYFIICGNKQYINDCKGGVA